MRSLEFIASEIRRVMPDKYENRYVHRILSQMADEIDAHDRALKAQAEVKPPEGFVRPSYEVPDENQFAEEEALFLAEYDQAARAAIRQLIASETSKEAGSNTASR